MSERRTLHRLHVWLGWLIGIPLLFWTASGLFMTSFPIEKVRGNHLKSVIPLVDARGAVLPKLDGPVNKLALVTQAGQPVWIVGLSAGNVTRFDGHTGRRLAAVSADEAKRLARAAYAGGASLAGVTAFSADAPPLELRRDRPSWQVRYADGTHIYIDAESGEMLALRTGLWRVFDWMWGLHIMDLGGRENTHHLLLYGFAGLAVVGVLTGLVLLPLARKARKRR